jgi:hypothetical protein
MKLKFELVNGYGVLVDHDKEMVLFAEKELGLDVPVFEWRDFDIEKLSEKSSELQEVSYTIPHAETYKHGFIDGYKSNPAKYTESDLRKAIELALIDAEKSVLWSVNYHICLSNKIIQSLQKYPKYVVIENEDMEFGVEKEYRPKLFTNSEGKQQGILKELIWD